MKPYILAGVNLLRSLFWRIKNRNITAENPLLIGLHSKCCFAKSSKTQIAGHLVTDGRFVIIVGENGELTIGDHVYFNEGGMISCHEKVHIGSGCRFGPNVKIFDNNHQFNAQEGVLDSHATGSISIGEHCWIGANAVILKGAVIADNCVIGAGCVVDCEIPSQSIVTQQRELQIIPMRKT